MAGLHTQRLTPPEGSATRWLFMLHGIYGRGGNWRSVARQLMQRVSGLGVVLVDLRMHGQSQELEGPHSLEACAEDLVTLVENEMSEGHDIAGILGHSFGGKVALQLRALRPDLALPLWIIDSSPSLREGQMDPEAGNTVVEVLRMLQELPSSYGQRHDFVDAVVERGFPQGLAQWLGMNLVSEDGGYRFGLNLSAMEELLIDYFARDLWPVVEEALIPISFAVASRGSALSAQDQEYLRELEGPTVHSRILDGGHWLHVEALDALVDFVAEGVG